MTIFFDPRCKINSEDRMTFSTRRGARDIGELFVSPFISFKSSTFLIILKKKILFPLTRINSDSFFYELKCDPNTTNRLEYGFRFTVLPVLTDEFLTTKNEECNFPAFPSTTPWNNEMYRELISLAISTASSRSYGLNYMTTGDFISFIQEEDNPNKPAEFDSEYPLDPLVYPKLHRVSIHEIRYRFALISILNQMFVLQLNININIILTNLKSTLIGLKIYQERCRYRWS